MGYVTGKNRNQIVLGTSLDERIDGKNPVRIIDSFVKTINLQKLGFSRTKPNSDGRPAYDPHDLAALYIYGNLHKVRSSRLLERECHVNIEMMWLMNELAPDFKTISDFRKTNGIALKKLFEEFNRVMRKDGTPEFYSIDGSKFRANNGRDRNFTFSKLDDRISRMTVQIEEYMRLLDEGDSEEETENSFSETELKEKISKTKERLSKYKSYLEYMQENELSQLSLTDRDSALMKTRNSYEVSHNVQTAVESDTHMIANFVVNNKPNDFGMLSPTMHEIREKSAPESVLECVADKGYNDRDDMMACLEKGIIPNVILPEGKDSYEVVTSYEASEITDDDLLSRDANIIKKCLRSGKIPEVYKGILKDAVVETVTGTIAEFDGEQAPRTEKEYIEEAKRGKFVRNIASDTVYCPAGNIMRRNAVRKDGGVRYTNRLACGKCPRRSNCTNSKKKYKTVEFAPGSQSVPCRLWPKNDKKAPPGRIPVKRTKITRTIVKFTLYPNRRQMDQRKCLSEHPFGTVKRALNGGYFLTCGNRNVAGEIALLFLAYNIKRALSYYGFDEVMSKIKAFAADSASFYRSFMRFSPFDSLPSFFRRFFRSPDRFLLPSLA